MDHEQTVIGSPLKPLYDALLVAFPSRGDLSALLMLYLNENLNSIAGEGTDLKQCVLNLLQWATAQSKLNDLVTAARSSNPHSIALRDAAETMGLISPIERYKDTLKDLWSRLRGSWRTLKNDPSEFTHMETSLLLVVSGLENLNDRPASNDTHINTDAVLEELYRATIAFYKAWELTKEDNKELSNQFYDYIYAYRIHIRAALKKIAPNGH